jgi:hypothetical protein
MRINCLFGIVSMPWGSRQTSFSAEKGTAWTRIAMPLGLESAGPASHTSLGLRPISADLAGTVLRLELGVDLDVGCQ